MSICKIIIALACVGVAVRGRRALSSDREGQAKSADSVTVAPPWRTLGVLLLAANPSAAFNPSGPAVRAVRPVHQRGALQRNAPHVLASADADTFGSAGLHGNPKRLKRALHRMPPRRRQGVWMGLDGAKPVSGITVDSKGARKAATPRAKSSDDDGSGPQPRYLSSGSIWPGSQVTVGELMTDVFHLLTVGPETTIKEAAMTMMSEKISGAPVIDEDGRLLGVISRTDLLRVISEGRAKEDAVSELITIEGSPVRDSMTTTPVTISPDATVLEAAQILYKQRINRLLVVDDEEQLLGLITSTDVVRIALCDELSEIVYDDDWEEDISS